MTEHTDIQKNNFPQAFRSFHWKCIQNITDDTVCYLLEKVHVLLDLLSLMKFFYGINTNDGIGRLIFPILLLGVKFIISRHCFNSWLYALYRRHTITRVTEDADHWHHDDVIKWKHFPRNWPFVRGNHRSPVNSPHKGQWRRALMFSLIYVCINDWVNNREAGDLRRYLAHCDVIVMT